MKIAIIGSGIAGNMVAHRLHREHDITVFEAAGHAGGHTHTHSVEQAGRSYEVDTGFIVFNDRTYPNFVALLDGLDVPSRASTMSFSVRVESTGLEYNGTSLDRLFAQRRNLLRPSFLRMIAEILRFNREAPAAVVAYPDMTLDEMLRRGRYSRGFVEHYVLPMGAAIWSTRQDAVLEFPARFFVAFLHNHGMLSVRDRPVWRTVRGGSARYVERMTAPYRDRIHLRTPVESIRRTPAGVLVKAHGRETCRYDAVFVACHADDALALLADPSRIESQILGAFPYQRNEAVLHTDTRLLPKARRAWAGWNYHVLPHGGGPVALTYNMNILQGLDAPDPFLVTLNRAGDVDPARVIKRIVYRHPLYTAASVASQARHAEINRGRGTYFCGAYWRNGFHEDGVVSALAAIAHFERDGLTLSSREAA